MENKASESHVEFVNYEEDIDDEGVSITPPQTPRADDEGVSITPPQTPRAPTVNFIFEDKDDSDEPTQPKIKRRRIGDGELSNSYTSNNKIEQATFVCEICADDKSANESFGVQNCSHSYCRYCIRRFVECKLQQNTTSTGCPVPDCIGSLNPEHCRPILPPELVERWENALRESTIDGSQRFYCPFKDCSTINVDRGWDTGCNRIRVP